MRHLSNHKLVGAAVPAALAGSIALLLSGPAAGATEREVEPQPARMPLLGVTGAVVPERAPASVAVPDAYTVARGDTVFGIAVRYGLRTADILAINGLSRDSIIRPGQVLRLTGSAPSTPAVVPSASAAASGTYAVAPGDTLSAIAKRHGITVQELFAANGLGWASIIYPGQTLRIGGGAAPGPAAPAAPAPPTAPPAPVAGSATHTVQAGDTLSAIARAHGITVQALFAATGLGSSSIIYPGQQIALPGAATAAPPRARAVPCSRTHPACPRAHAIALQRAGRARAADHRDRQGARRA